MSAHLQDTQKLLEKIQSLPTSRVAEVEDFVDFLRKRVSQQETASKRNKSLDFPVDDLGPWPTKLSLHREDMYGDGER